MALLAPLPGGGGSTGGRGGQAQKWAGDLVLDAITCTRREIAAR